MIPLLRPTRETYLIKMHSILECPATLYSTKFPPFAEMITVSLKTFNYEADGCETNTANIGDYKPTFGKRANMNERYITLWYHCCRLMNWCTQYYDVGNSRSRVSDIYWYPHGRAGENRQWVIRNSAHFLLTIPQLNSLHGERQAIKTAPVVRA